MEKQKEDSFQVPSPFLTRQELMQRWHCSKRFMQGFRNLPFTKIGRTILYRVSDIEACERENVAGKESALPSAKVPDGAPELATLHAAVKELERAQAHHESILRQLIGQCGELQNAIAELKEIAPPQRSDSEPETEIVRAVPLDEELPERPGAGRGTVEQNAMMDAFLRFINRPPEETSSAAPEAE